MINDKSMERLIDVALDSGADRAEIFISERQETEITVAKQKPESVIVRDNRGFGIRVLVNSRMGFYSSNKSDELEVIEKVRDLVKSTKLHTPDPFNILPENHLGMDSSVQEVYDPQMTRAPLSEKIRYALEIEKAGQEYDSRIAGFVWVLYGDTAENYRVISSTGIDISSRGSVCYGFAYCYASDGKTVQSGRNVNAYGHLHEFNPKEIGVGAAKYALRMLGSKDFSGGNITALFPPEAGIPLVHSIFGMIEADSVQKGKSPFREKLGKQVASRLVNIIDDGTLPGGLGTRPFDAEGTPTTKTMVIEDGILRNYLYDSYTAKKGNTKSTGNAFRAGYGSKPYINPTNFCLSPGMEDENDILQDIQNGIMITELSGLHAGINYATADFSVPAKGILINSGEAIYPVDNISISGNIFDLLGNISRIGRNLAWEPTERMIGSPTFMVENLKVIGRG
jgi:PmbA protein